MLRLVLFVLLSVSGSALAAPVLLWYNGDYDYMNALANERNTANPPAAVYDNFNVPDPGWLITRIFSNNVTMQITSPITTADWEIRSGVTEGDGGTLIASGTGAPASWTPTGRSLAHFIEYQLAVDGLSVSLPPGQYWLMVRPVGSGVGRSFLSKTSGANGVNALLDGNHFLTRLDEGHYFSRFFSDTGADFSMGVYGYVLPEPTTMGLAAAGLLSLLFRRRR